MTILNVGTFVTRVAPGCGVLACLTLALHTHAAPPKVSAAPAKPSVPTNTKPATGFTTTKNEVLAGRALGSAAQQPQASKPTIEIWCANAGECGVLEGVTRREGRLHAIIRQGNVHASASTGAKIQASVLQVTPDLTHAPFDEGTRSVLWVVATPGAYAVHELAPTKPGEFKVVRTSSIAGDIKAVAAVWPAQIDATASWLLAKSRVAPSAAAAPQGPAFLGQDALSQRKSQAISPTADKKARGLWSGLKTDISPGYIFRVNNQRPECTLKGAWSESWALNHYGTDIPWASCIELVAIDEHFHGLDPKWLSDPKLAIDLSALDLVPAVGNQGFIGSCVSWSSAYVAFTNLIWRVNGGKRQASAAGQNAVTPNAVNPLHVHRLSKVQSTPANMTVAAKTSRKLTQYITTTFDRTSPCSDGNAVANVIGLLQQADVGLVNTSGDLTSCEVPFTVADRVKAGHGLQDSDIKPRAIDADVDAVRAALALGSAVVISAPASLFLSYTGKVFAEPAKWRDASTGDAWQSSITAEHRRIGGHAVAVVGFDNGKRAFKIQNSWGTQWGEKGYMWLSYDVFNEWTDNLAYYFDCVGACKPVAPVTEPEVSRPTANVEFTAAYTSAWDDAWSLADPRADVYVDGLRVCTLARENSRKLSAKCPGLALKPGQEFTVYFWEQDSKGHEFVGGLGWAPSRSAAARYKLGGGVSGLIKVAYQGG